MRQFRPYILGPIFLLGGAFAVLLLRGLPPASLYFWLIPAVLLTGGLFCVMRLNWWALSILGICGGLLVLAMRLLLWPPAGNGQENLPTDSLQPLHQTTLQVPQPLRHGLLASPHSLEALPGLNIAVFAAELENPRMLAFSPAGKLYVSLPGEGQVVVLSDSDRDGVADGHRIFVAGLDRPHGLAFVGNDLLVAENARLVRLPNADGNRQADRIEVISKDLPGGGGHWTRSVVIGQDGAIYVSAGSSCNACIETDPRRAAILSIDPQSGTARVYARGLRNSVGLATHPQSGDLWASNNGRDMLGDDLPPEEINRILAGGDYGWPYCYGQQTPDPEFGSPERCRTTLAPEVEMQAHSAPLGIAFGAGLDFPHPLQNMLFVAFHGSWNRSQPTGYKLIGIPFQNGRPSGPPQDIVRGWLQGHSAWGRPVAPVVGPDGALYLSDDRAGLIYRITAKK